MRWVYVKALIVAVILALSFTVSSESDIVAERLHTLGFPYAVGDLESLIRLFRGLASISGNSTIQDVASRLENCDSLDCLYDNRIIAGMIDRALKNSTGFNYGTLKSSDSGELLKLIEDLELRNIVEGIMEAGAVDPSTIASILDKAWESKNSGRLSDSGYMALLEILKRIAENTGDKKSSQLISKEQVKEAARLIGENKSVIEELINMAQNIWGKYGGQQGLPSLAQESSKYQTRRRPTPSLSLSLTTLEIPINLLIPLIAIILIAGALYAALSIAPKVIDMGSPKRPWLSKMGELAGTLKLYWESVKLVEKRTKVYMKDTSTHREYAETVKNLLGHISEPFKNITLAYEKLRFGGAPEETISEDAVKNYEELRKNL